MRDGWREGQLSDLITFKNGKKRPSEMGIYPVYGGNGILDYAISSNYENIAIVGRVGAYCGSVYYEPNKCWVSDNAIAAIALESSCIKYCYYLLSNLQLNKRHIGTSQPLLTQEILNNITTSIPPLPEQRAIAATLSSLDDKIELNNKINANLEAQAQAIFDNWFNSDMSNEWSVGKLSEIANLNPKRSLTKGVNATYVEMSNLPTNGAFPHDWEKTSYSGGSKFQNGDTLLARITPCLENGKTAYVNFLENDEIAFGSTEYIVLSPKEGYPSELLYFLARNNDFVSYAVKNMCGTSGRQRVSAGAIASYEMKIPPIDFVVEYADVFASIMKAIRQNSFENRTLSVLRDTLLPKLMSGEIEVPVAV